MKKTYAFMGIGALAVMLLSPVGAQASASAADGSMLVADRDDYRGQRKEWREDQRERQKEWREERNERREEMRERDKEWREHRKDNNGRSGRRPDYREHRGDGPGQIDHRPGFQNHQPHPDHRPDMGGRPGGPRPGQR